MASDIPIGISNLPLPSEGGNANHLWKQTRDAAARAQQLTSVAGNVQRELASIQQPRPPDFGMFPWKVYTLPAEVRELIGVGNTRGPVTPTPDQYWRTICVRTGTVKNAFNFFNHTMAVHGRCDVACRLTDLSLPLDIKNGSDFTVDSSTYTWKLLNKPVRAFGDIDIICEENVKTWVFIELVTNPDTFATPFTAGTPFTTQIKAAVIPATEGWTNFPYFNPYFTPIAVVDTYTMNGATITPAPSPGNPDPEPVPVLEGNPKNTALIHQLFWGDLDLMPAPKVYGAYSSTLFSQGYPYNAIVSVTDGGTVSTYQSKRWFNSYSPTTESAWFKIGEYSA